MSQRTGECRLLLIFEVHKDLVISIITIQKTIILVPSQMLYHLINEWEWEVIIPGSGIQLAVVYTNSSSQLNMSWPQLVVLILHYCQTSPHGHDMNWAHPLAIRD